MYESYSDYYTQVNTTCFMWVGEGGVVLFNYGIRDLWSLYNGMSRFSWIVYIYSSVWNFIPLLGPKRSIRYKLDTSVVFVSWKRPRDLIFSVSFSPSVSLGFVLLLSRDTVTNRLLPLQLPCSLRPTDLLDPLWGYTVVVRFFFFTLESEYWRSLT